jgi:adenine deaminase
MQSHYTLHANRVDVETGTVAPARITVEHGVIAAIEPTAARCDSYLLPGLVDAHVHIESSMLAPCAFGRAAVVHGVVASVSDPHEIANVLGVRGVQWMVDDARHSPFKFHFGAPSCVPATRMETAGAQLGAAEIGALLDSGDVHYLSEVMNFPAVIHGDPALRAILDCARQRKVPIDGHAPGVMGTDLHAYAAAGITTDHECYTLDQALARIALGMKVAIREGSAARNFEALWPALSAAPDSVFLCADDKHPDDLVAGYLNDVLRRCVAKGVDAMVAIRAATRNPVRHYRMPVGLLQVGDPADMVEVDNLTDFRVMRTWINGRLVAEHGQPLIDAVQSPPINQFHAVPVTAAALQRPWPADKPFPVIVAADGQLVTGREDLVPPVVNGHLGSDPSRDLLKIVVVNRYTPAPPAIGLIRNFGLRSAALAGSVAHDSHNIVAVGANDAALVRAINAVIAAQGGLAYADANLTETLALPIAGLMSDREAWPVAAAFEKLTALARADGCRLASPFMTLSFMALLVIPELKISDLGLFDGRSFQLILPGR